MKLNVVKNSKELRAFIFLASRVTLAMKDIEARGNIVVDRKVFNTKNLTFLSFSNFGRNTLNTS